MSRQKVGNHYFDLTDVYTNSSRGDFFSKILSLSSTVAVCPLGGPIAAIVGKHLYVFTPAYEKLIDAFDLSAELSKKSIFIPSLIVGVWWSLEPAPVLIILLSDGTEWRIRMLRTLGLIEQFMERKDDAKFSKDSIVAISIFRPNNGISVSEIVLTQSMRFYKDRETLLDFISLPPGVGVVCFVQLDHSAVVISLDDGSVVVADVNCKKTISITPASAQIVQLMSISFSGKYLAVYTSGCVVSVYSVSELLHVVTEGELSIAPVESSPIDIGIPPSQIAWVGDDAVAVGFASKTRNVVFIGLGAWTPYEFDSAVTLVSDLGRLALVTKDQYQVGVRVQPASLAVDSPETPAGRLIAGYKKFLANEIESESIVRGIKTQIDKAVLDCIEVATTKDTNLLLKAALFGRQFDSSPICAKFFVHATSLIRVCRELNTRGIPVSVAQLQSGMDWRLIGEFLVARGEYLLALKIATWLGITTAIQSIFTGYGIDLVSNSDHLTDGELCECIVERMQSLNVSLGEISKFANQMGRTKLAIALLEFEPSTSVRVDLLISLGGESAIEAALEEALRANKIDLINICFDELIKRKQPVGDVFSKFVPQFPILTEVASQRFLSEKKFDDLAKLFPHTSVAAVAGLENGLNKNIPEWFQFAAERFAEIPNDYLAMNCASLLADHSQLMRDQADLEKMAAAKGWPRGPHKFLGLSADETIERLLVIGEYSQADIVRSRRKMSEGRFWDLRAKILVQCDRMDELAQMPSPPNNDCFGYKLVVEMLLARNKPAVGFIRKLKPKSQAKFFHMLGMAEEARMAESANRSTGAALFGKLTSGFMGR
jgi:hypothetical protein